MGLYKTPNKALSCLVLSYETTMAARTGKSSVLTILRKTGDCKQFRWCCAHYPNNG